MTPPSAAPEPDEIVGNDDDDRFGDENDSNNERVDEENSRVYLHIMMNRNICAITTDHRPEIYFQDSGYYFCAHYLMIL